MLTPTEFALAMAPIYATWPKETPTEKTLEVYYLMVMHVPYAVLAGAALEVLSAPTYGFPKPHDLLEGAVQVIMQQRDLSEGWARQELDEARAACVLEIEQARQNFLAVQAPMPARLPTGRAR